MSDAKTPLTMHDVSTIEQLKQLLSSGADVNEKNLFEETPLISALRREVDVKVISEFIKCGADVNIKDCWGVSPLYCAVARHAKNLALIKLLLDSGADIESGKRISDRFLDHTVTHKQLCAKLLIRYKFLKNFALLNGRHTVTDINIRRDYYREYKDIVDLDLRRSSYDYLGDFLDGCAAEIRRMQLVVIDNNLSLLHFVTTGALNLNDIGCLKSLIKKTYEGLSRNDYPLFKDIILEKIGKQKVMNVINDTLLNPGVKKVHFLNVDIMFCISQFLTTENLLTVAIALLF